MRRQPKADHKAEEDFGEKTCWNRETGRKGEEWTSADQRGGSQSDQERRNGGPAGRVTQRSSLKALDLSFSLLIFFVVTVF